MDKINLQKYKNTESVIILPYVEDKVLMQLRDEKKSIIFPGKWGFFGGGINEKESPEDAARRELFEELDIKPKSLNKFFYDNIPELAGHMSHAFCCPLSVPIQNIKLYEGMDLGLFSIEQVNSGKLYSSRFNKFYPVMKIPHILNTLRALFIYINQN